MNDRELLELAAKAAGVNGGWGEIVHIGEDKLDLTDLFFVDNDENCAVWNPLTDDGDSLRLALALRLDVEFEGPREVRVKYDGTDGVPCMVDEYLSSKDAASDLRRAIVRAAAEIGRIMP